MTMRCKVGNSLPKSLFEGVESFFGRDEGGGKGVKGNVCKYVHMYGCRLIYVCNMLCFPLVP